MIRIAAPGFRDAVSSVLDRLPEPLRMRLERTEFVYDLEPPFLGLSAWSIEKYAGRTYYPHHTTDRSTTIVLRRLERDAVCSYPLTVAHELGHVLHATIEWRYVAEPVSEYACTNHYEAFADAFQCWVFRLYPVSAPDDRRTLRLFEDLAEVRIR